jgi:DNA-binding NtrC family response regulator
VTIMLEIDLDDGIDDRRKAGQTPMTETSERSGTTRAARHHHARGFQGFIGESQPMRKLYRLLENAGPSTASVLLVGESGTGKELAARTLHELSERSRSPFVAVNCAAIPDTLIEGELFGHEKGAFTGATSRQQGCFELAHGGTLFLDELTAMPLASQVKLLRALEEKSFRRLRGSEEIKVDLRILAATNQCPAAAVRAGKLREDLLYRIDVFTLEIPPLRERASDVPLLAESFIAQFAEQNGKGPQRLDPDAEAALVRYPWPGNVRELRNAMERAVILATDSVIRFDHLPPSVRAGAFGESSSASRLAVASDAAPVEDSDRDASFPVGMTLEEATRSLMLRTLEATHFNKTRTARILGVSPKTVYNKLKEWSSTGDLRARRGETLSRRKMGRPAEADEGSTAWLVSIDSGRRRRVG